jgi:hypothetical protein
MKEGNDTLKTLLGLSDKLAPMRRRRNQRLSSSWNSIRKQASSFFEALASSWLCRCSCPHSVGLLLLGQDELQVQSNSFNFDLWFSFRMGTDISPQSLPWHSQLAKVCTIQLTKQDGVGECPDMPRPENQESPLKLKK